MFAVISSHTETGKLVKERAYTSPIRQPDSGGLHPQRGRNALTESFESNMQIVDADGPKLNIRLSAHYFSMRYYSIADHLSRGKRLPE